MAGAALALLSAAACLFGAFLKPSQAAALHMLHGRITCPLAAEATVWCCCETKPLHSACSMGASFAPGLRQCTTRALLQKNGLHQASSWSGATALRCLTLLMRAWPEPASKPYMLQAQGKVWSHET